MLEVDSNSVNLSLYFERFPLPEYDVICGNGETMSTHHCPEKFHTVCKHRLCLEWWLNIFRVTEIFGKLRVIRSSVRVLLGGFELPRRKQPNPVGHAENTISIACGILDILFYLMLCSGTSSYWCPDIVGAAKSSGE